MMEYTLLKKEYAASAARLEASCLDEAWSEQSIAGMVSRPDAVYAVCVENGEVLGCAGAVIACDEANITNVAVSASCRRMGIAKTLMSVLLDECKRRGCTSAFLEVAADNTPAIALYGSVGFSRVGVRKHFYRSSDALIMRADI